ncbi:DNA polymerase [Ralstonia phage RS-PII-1]|uniref:DNA polymerase n=1 Tax=Ralstonia phage RS-PII-1 TaxID=1932892 RepID=A0A1L7DQB7_9CAUD|nr:DNA polymerase [Ralstonia phage RS-PII-1]APU00317.1 DNA polymerase I [Ralstonia phage RS-PII-1]
MNYTCWDLETSTRTEYKRKANPFSAENYIVAQGACRARLSDPFSLEQGARPFGEYFPAMAVADDRDARIAACKALPEDWFTRHLVDTKLLVGVNIKFDLLYALANPNSHPERNLQAWMDYVNGGGTIWDCQIAEYLLQGMEQSSQMLAMDEMAPTYGGTLKVDEVKALWNAGVDTIDIPEDLLMRYLLGEGGDKGDIGNTELIFRGQWERAKKSGQLRSILLNMGSLLFTIEAERNGMHVDKALGEELAEKLAAALAKAHVELAAYIPEDLPFEFNWNSRFHKSALIFGGRVKYTAKADVLDESGQPTYFQKDETHYLLADGSTMEVAAFDKLVSEGVTTTDPGKALVRFAGGKNKGEPKTKKVKVPDIERGPKQRNEDFHYVFPGFTKPDPKWESQSDPGVYSTSSDVIEALGNRNIPFLKTLSEVVAMTKDLGTYFWVEDDKNPGQKKGMLTLVQLDSIIHHMLNHTSTVTARLSSSNPNLQNLSKGQKSDVKLMFTSRFGADGVICQSDFSSLEVYVQAILTKALLLIEDLKSGKDMHCVRLAAKEGMDYDRVFELCKIIADPEWDYKRTGAKVFSFQRAYGAGVKTIAESTGMAEEEVQALADAEDARYPEINVYFEGVTQQLLKGRRPTGKTVQHPEIKGLEVQLGRAYFTTPDGKRYCFYESPAPKFMVERGKRTGFSPTEIKNYPVQGTGGEWAKAAMWLSLRAFYHYRNFNGLALLVNQVHDAEYGDFHKSVAAKAAALLHVCMEEASTFMEWWFKWELPLGVPSDTVWGSNMMEENKITDPVFDKAVAALRPWVRKRFIGNHTPTFH